MELAYIVKLFIQCLVIECNEIFQDEGNFTSLVEVAEDKWLSHDSKLLNNDLRKDDRLSWAGKF